MTISEKLILKHAPSNIGDQIHINHEGCDSGEDTKKRLYLKRVENGILAFCHHCSEKGFVREKRGGERLSRWFDKTKAVVPPRHSISLEIEDEIPMLGKLWLHKYHCSYSADYASEYFRGVRSNPQQIALKLFDTNNNNSGWQVRNLDGSTPKYITQYLNTTVGSSSWFSNDSDTLVITEDYLSAFRVYRDTSFSSLALLRTSISDRTLQEIYQKEFVKIKIWLDPDEAGIVGREKALRKLSYFLPLSTKVQVVVETKEPKQLTPEQLRKVLCGL